MTGKTGRFAIIEQLLADDMHYMFGNPGTVEQGFLDALSDYPDLKYIVTLQEAVAVGIADGYARATKRPTVVQLHSGVGLGNGIGMLYQAKRGHAPLVVINGDAGLRYDAMDAQMAADLVAIAEPVTKWATRVVDPASLLRVLRRAIKIAATPPMGPVFVCLPMDILDAPNEEAVIPTSFPVTRVAPEPDQIAQVAALLAAAQQPLFIIGDGVAASAAQTELTRVAELTGAQVWGADSSEVNMSASHPLFKDQLGHMFGEHSRAITSQADVVLICGTYVFPEVFPALSGVFASGAKVIHIDLNAYEVAKNFPVDIGLISDPKTTLAKVAAALETTMTASQKAAAKARVSAHTAAKEQEVAAWHEADTSRREAVPLHASRFMEELAAQLPKDAIIFDEALTTSPDLVHALPPTTPGTYFLTRGGSLGVGIPGAIGIKLAHPDKTVIGFCGDGGSMYTIQALWTAAHHRIGAKLVICNNHSYKLLKLNLQQYWRERQLPEHVFPASFDIDDPGIHFAELAQAMGVKAVRVETPQQIGPAVRQALADDEPFLIDLVISNDVPGHVVQKALHKYSQA
ncbi:MAG: thiamine pyrophosphate-binding protein [Ktedonobacteraceae bacterium]|nr:thiamine pyrophosphate-binding protein [Ktedonobacteraceae bacterium]